MPDNQSASAEEKRIREAVLRKLDQWKKHLIDLTKRNKLLYFSPSKATIKITDPSISELLKKIVIDGKQLSFPMLKKERQLLLKDEEAEITENQKEDAVKPGDIETNVGVRELQTRLYRLGREWKTWQEEQGIHTLFLVLGVLKWQESEHENKAYLAPLVLIPIGLVKEGGDKPYEIEFVEEDIVPNPALAYKLKNDFNIELPDFPEDITEESLEKYLAKIEGKVKAQGWTVLREAWIGRFSFEKYVMYQDLENYREDACQHPVVKALASAGALPQPSDMPPIDRLDDAVNPEEVFPVLDSDSSQTEVLVRARAGQNLVVHGPPGTGKSQTIVNLIAQMLRDGKRVLFVSEKMAALEVVYRRLKETGVSVGCLEVHSHHKDKGSVIEDLGATLQHRLASNVSSEASEKFKTLIRRRGSLNSYVHELHLRRGPMKRSAFEVHGKLAKLMSAVDLDFTPPWERAVDVAEDALGRAVEAITALAQADDVVSGYSSHPWKGAEINLDKYSLQYRDKLIASLKSLRLTADELKKLSDYFKTDLGLSEPETFDQIKKSSELLSALLEPVSEMHNWLSFDDNEIAERLRWTKEGKERSEAYSQLKGKLLAMATEGILTIKADELLHRFKTEYKSALTRWIKRGYWQDKASIISVCKSKKLKYPQIIVLLSDAIDFKTLQDWFSAQEANLQRLFGGFYKVEATDWAFLHKGLSWMVNLKAYLPSGRPTSQIIEYVKNPSRLRPRLTETLSRISELLQNSAVSREAISGIFQRNQPMVEAMSLAELSSWLQPKENTKQLDDWVTFLQFRNECRREKLDSFIDEALKANQKAEQLLPTFLKQLWKSWLSEVYAHSAALREFRGHRHEDNIREFQALDRDLKKITAAATCASIESRQPKRVGAQSSESQVGILLREMQKRRRHKSLRRLFSEIPHLLQELKPCLLMSPLSVASYLAKEAFSFDLIIFDEASQIPPADAIGAVLRGKQLIVAGDDKQLPPTRFFQADFEDIQEEERDSEPLESVLNECKALPGFIESPLLWHYRSRFEELISFSNRYFYRSQLVTFPSPHPSGESGAIKFVHVADGLYDRGGTRTNRIEAKRVVDLIAEHVKKQGAHFSLGVITLSFAQEEAVLEEWERRKVGDPELASLTEDESDEPLFIKALEKVQGDERDCIILSIGYGKDSNGVLHHHFGPINQFGGERRLNVAVTRARFQTMLVSSFLPHELDLARLTTANDGVVKLQQYLEYAKNGGRFPEVSSGQGAVELNDFEESVKQALEARGLKVDGQVGCSGFRIDLAIRHPEYPNRYILGVECDGATYHSHRTARDRDRLREEVLVALGWKIHRIWSTDWIKEPESVVNRALAKFEELKKHGVAGVEVPRRARQTNVSEPKLNSEVLVKTTENGTKVSAPKPPFPTYQPYAPTHRRQSDSFYKTKSRVGNRMALTSDVEEVVRHESPVHPEVLAQRIGDLYGFGRIGNKIEAIVNKIVELIIREGKITKKNGFLWQGADNQVAQARINGEGGAKRNVEHVAIEELASIVEWLLQNEYGLPLEALVKRTAQVMGYDRTGENVRERIEKAIDHLLKIDRITAYGDQLILKST